MTDQEIYEIDFRLINWERWYRDSKIKGRCKSIEHRYNYRSDKMDGEEVVIGESAPAYMEADGADAAKVNRAWQALPKLNNKLIAAHYDRRKNKRKDAWKDTCRLLGIRFSEYDVTLLRSQQMVFNLLRFYK
jgi:hypothetical protein